MSTHRIANDREALGRLFTLDPETGILTRRITKGSRGPKGAAVGTVDGRGYLHVFVDGEFIRVHRIVFLLHYGWLPEQIDHKDRNRLNNRPSNLRAADSRQNSGNIIPPKHNTSGFKGVSKNSSSGFWHAQIKIHGKQTYLGRTETPEAAYELYCEAARKHFGEFAAL